MAGWPEVCGPSATGPWLAATGPSESATGPSATGPSAAACPSAAGKFGRGVAALNHPGGPRPERGQLPGAGAPGEEAGGVRLHAEEDGAVAAAAGAGGRDALRAAAAEGEVDAGARVGEGARRLPGRGRSARVSARG